MLTLPFDAQVAEEIETLSLALLSANSFKSPRNWTPGYTREVEKKAGALLCAPAPVESHSYPLCPPRQGEVAVGPTWAVLSPQASGGSHGCISASSEGAALSGS